MAKKCRYVIVEKLTVEMISQETKHIILSTFLSPGKCYAVNFTKAYTINEHELLPKGSTKKIMVLNFIYRELFFNTVLSQKDRSKLKDTCD
jgi:hypothetical protein